MAFVTNILTPIIKGVFLVVFFGGWFIAAGWLLMKYVLTKKLRFWIKFNIFKKPYPEDEVEWCMNALDKGWDDPSEIRKFLLTHSNFTLKKVEQILFIFSELKKLKGGVTDGRSIRQSSGETQFPKIKEKNSEEK